MTRALAVTLLSCFLGFVTGCGDTADPEPDEGNPFEGTYKVTSHTKDEMGCTGPGTEVTGGDTFFRLTEENLFGTAVLAYRTCTDATTCEESTNLFASFINMGNGWVRHIETASGTSETCALSLTEGPLVETETGLRLESRTHSADVMLNMGEECDTDLVEPRRDELTCTAIEILVADKL
ncbi:hypothetical protein [Polyangium jinanense]|uniref:Lipoprotein n=1 Tax=Polyangium jinanense TaxID=2829994 RepID=A0A9X3X2N5_9BACT|nr:hypothetical protein [Polyangium jinanense]MDC3981670.1 hypothetical protein [Polyangium jinanense]